MSDNFEKVKRYFEKGLWSESRVHNAVNRWITPVEYLEITGKEYK
ncbi:XkdX family protein [[Clostridium] symbiosum]